MKQILIIVVLLTTCGCSSLAKKSILIEPGMSKTEVVNMMGAPEGRSFKDNSEALQYQEVAGFGQCAYVTIWLRDSKVVAVTTRNGPSVAGCGLGSREVDWGQMPRPSMDININSKSEYKVSQ